MGGTEDDLFDQDDDEFEGFHPREVEDAEELNANMQAELAHQDTPNIEIYSESDENPTDQEDYDTDPGIPGN